MREYSDMILLAFLLYLEKEEINQDLLDSLETKNFNTDLPDKYFNITYLIFQIRYQKFLCYLCSIFSCSKSELSKHVIIFKKLEFQQRGAPHLHILLWIRNSLKKVELLTKKITCTIEAEDENYDILQEYQLHAEKEKCKNSCVYPRLLFFHENQFIDKNEHESQSPLFEYLYVEIQNFLRSLMISESNEIKDNKNFNSEPEFLKLIENELGIYLTPEQYYRMIQVSCRGNREYIYKRTTLHQCFTVPFIYDFFEIFWSNTNVERIDGKLSAMYLTKYAVKPAEFKYSVDYLNQLQNSRKRSPMIEMHKSISREMGITRNMTKQECHVFSIGENIFDLNVTTVKINSRDKEFACKAKNGKTEKYLTKKEKYLLRSSKFENHSMIEYYTEVDPIDKNGQVVENTRKTAALVLLEPHPLSCQASNIEKIVYNFNCSLRKFIYEESSLNISDSQFNKFYSYYKLSPLDFVNPSNVSHDLSDTSLEKEQKIKEITSDKYRVSDMRKIVEIYSEFTQEQFFFFSYILSNYLKKSTENNLYLLTGSAGTGKSYYIRKMCEVFKIMKIQYCVTTTTGISAHNLGCETIHATLKFFDTSQLYLSEYLSKSLKKKYGELTYLIIDEGYRLNLETLRVIDFRLRSIKDNNLSFGGVTVILSGDPYQTSNIKGQPIYADFIEHSNITPNIYLDNYRKVKFTTPYRNTNYTDGLMLEKIRKGNITEADVNQLNKIVKVKKDPDIDSTVVTKTRSRAKDYNSSQLVKLESDVYTIHALDNSSNHNLSEEDLQLIEDETNLQTVLEFAINAKIFITRNINKLKSICNGAIGNVIEYNSEKNYILIRFIDKSINNGNLYKLSKTCITAYIGSLGLCWRTQYPCKLGFSTTIHYIQGSTIPSVHFLNNHKVFSQGENYTALSRTKNLADISVERKFNLTDFKVSDNFTTFIENVPEYDKSVDTNSYTYKILYVNCHRKPFGYEILGKFLDVDIIALVEVNSEDFCHDKRYYKNCKIEYINNIRDFVILSRKGGIQSKLRTDIDVESTQIVDVIVKNLHFSLVHNRSGVNYKHEFRNDTIAIGDFNFAVSDGVIPNDIATNINGNNTDNCLINERYRTNIGITYDLIICDSDHFGVVFKIWY